MNAISIRSFAASFLCLALASCHPLTSADPSAKTVVWDVHGSPPAPGYALLMQPSGPNGGMWTTTWTPLSDTLEWDHSTGELEWPHVPLDAWWHVESSDPCHPGTMRVARFPAFSDTCHMTSHTTLHLSGKMHRTLGAPVTGYRLEFKPRGASNWQVAETWNMNCGTIQCVLPIQLNEGPWSFQLLRMHDNQPPKVVHDTTATMCQEDGWSWVWNDFNAANPQP